MSPNFKLEDSSPNLINMESQDTRDKNDMQQSTSKRSVHKYWNQYFNKNATTDNSMMPQKWLSIDDPEDCIFKKSTFY